MSNKPLVSIIIPCIDVDDYTRECIRHCKQLDYDGFEVILLPDDSKERLEGVNVAATGPVPPGAKRNRGIEVSRGELCAFIDNDAYPRSDWLTNAVKYLADPDVAGVGGPGLTPEADGLMQKAGGYILSSLMVGNLSSRYQAKQSCESDDIHSCNFVARKTVLKEAGGWNEKYWPGEDTLLCLKLKKLGKKMVQCRDVVVYHHRRPLFKHHLRQVSNFGLHRGFFAKKFPETSRRFTYFLPSLFISFLVVAGVVSLFYPVFRWVLGMTLLLYLFLTLAAALPSKTLLLEVWLGTMATHIVYGASFFLGLMRKELTR